MSPQKKRGHVPPSRAQSTRQAQYIPPAGASGSGSNGGRGTKAMQNRGVFGGCGLFVVVIALLAIIALVGFLVSGLITQKGSGSDRIPVPDNVPPAAAKPAPDIDIHQPGRTSEQLRRWAQPISEQTGIPVPALMAYGNAEVIARETRPECHITWNTLAGLGYVETRHGTYDGRNFGASEIQDDGVARPPIIGPRLDGNGFADVGDTDNGELDGDKEYDHAVGPMQFIPESWKRFGVDADGNGEADPNNIDDAAASAVRLLCDQQRDMATPEGWTRAIRAYNLSGEYVRKVRDAAANYALGQRPAG